MTRPVVTYRADEQNTKVLQEVPRVPGSRGPVGGPVSLCVSIVVAPVSVDVSGSGPPLILPGRREQC